MATVNTNSSLVKHPSQISFLSDVIARREEKYNFKFEVFLDSVASYNQIIIEFRV